MCGIFGVCADPDGTGLDERAMNSCRDTLWHRGPDAAGAFQDRGLYLGFRRLAINDLSSEGNQPMRSPDGRYVIVFNGEIYNFHELRCELEKMGEVFRGRSDTEVLLRWWMREGVRAISRLNGMFAFAIYDSEERELTLVRDRLGVKPLFIAKSGRNFAFASEVRAFKGLDWLGSGIDNEALAMYFAVGWVPESSSVMCGVHKLPSASYLTYSLRQAKITATREYWRLPPADWNGALSEADWIDRIDELISDATRIRLRADVPVGVFLSGGVDSGLIAAAAKVGKDDIAALTVAFPGQENDERSEATVTANHLGLQQIVAELELTNVYNELPSIVGHFDEPFADPSAIPTLMICREARKRFTVVLSGDGGDEMFAGYNNHMLAAQWAWLDSIPAPLRAVAGAAISRLSPQDSRWRRLGRKISPSAGLFGIGGKSYPFTDWRKRVLQPEFVVDQKSITKRYAHLTGECVSSSVLDQAQRSDIRIYMQEDILPKVDRMSMYASLEVRSPFLDYRLVESALRVPLTLRIRNGHSKYLLRKLAERKLPQATASGAKKGFGVPLRSWIFNSVQSRSLREQLIEADSGYPNPFQPGGAEQLWRLAEADGNMVPFVYWGLAYRWWCRNR